MKALTAAIILISLIYVKGTAAAGAVKGPKIVLAATTADLGSMSKKEGEAKISLDLRNEGSDNLVITNLRTSCGCVRASLISGVRKNDYFGGMGAPKGWLTEIAPGGSGTLEILIDLNHPSMTMGKNERDVFILTNDPFTPETGVHITLNLTE